MKVGKFITLSAIVLTVAILSQSFKTASQRPEKKLKNIKAFPSSMTYEQVDHEMDKFKAALNVKCNYCHAQTKESAPKLDMASDDNPKKEIARSMIRMTMDMNQKYMSTIPHSDTTNIQQITCNTCHRGQTKPGVDNALTNNLISH
jgi:cytochrome c5